MYFELYQLPEDAGGIGQTIWLVSHAGLAGLIFIACILTVLAVVYFMARESYLMRYKVEHRHELRSSAKGFARLVAPIAFAIIGVIISANYLLTQMHNGVGVNSATFIVFAVLLLAMFAFGSLCSTAARFWRSEAGIASLPWMRRQA